MDEARRFLRYVIPGSVFAIQTVVLLLLIIPEWTKPRLQDLQRDSGFGLAVGALLGSGALGFLFSTIHHWLHWHSPAWLHPGVDYLEMIRRLRGTHTLQLLDSRTGALVGAHWEPTRPQAWAIVTALWHERVLSGTQIGAANARADTLSNLVHSIGAATVGSFTALITALVVVLHLSSPSLELWPATRFGFAILLGLCSIGAHAWSYRDVLAISEFFVEQVLTDTFLSPGNQLPVQTRVPIG